MGSSAIHLFEHFLDVYLQLDEFRGCSSQRGVHICKRNWQQQMVLLKALRAGPQEVTVGIIYTSKSKQGGEISK